MARLTNCGLKTFSPMVGGLLIDFESWTKEAGRPVDDVHLADWLLHRFGGTEPFENATPEELAAKPLRPFEKGLVNRLIAFHKITPTYIQTPVGRMAPEEHPNEKWAKEYILQACAKKKFPVSASWGKDRLLKAYYDCLGAAERAAEHGPPLPPPADPEDDTRDAPEADDEGNPVLPHADETDAGGVDDAGSDEGDR